MSFLSATFEDSRKRTTKRLIEVEDIPEMTLANYMAVATAYATEVEPLTDLALVRLQIILDTPEVFDGTPPSNVDVGATFVGWTDSEPPHKATHKVPGIKDALSAEGGVIALGQADVAAYLTLFTDAGGQLLLSHKEHITAWVKGTLDK